MGFGAKSRRRRTATNASGGLIQNTDGQPKVSVSQPPTTGPPAVVRAEAAAHTPIARFLSALGNVAPIKARLAGVRIAAAIPCATRRPTSHQIVGARAHAAEARPNSEHPTASMRALP